MSSVSKQRRKIKPIPSDLTYREIDELFGDTQVQYANGFSQIRMADLEQELKQRSEENEMTDRVYDLTGRRNELIALEDEERTIGETEKVVEKLMEILLGKEYQQDR